jgi:autotransporter-associated beta strand protein
MDRPLRLMAIVFFGVLFAVATPATAQYVWTGHNGNGNWSTVSYWSGGSIPVSGSATTITFPNASGLPTLQDIANPFVLNQLTFNANSSGYVPFTIRGDALNFVSNGSTLPTLALNGIATTISAPLALGSNLTVTGLGSDLTLSGPITGTGTLVVTGSVVVLTNTANTVNITAQGEIIQVSDMSTNGVGALGTGQITLSGTLDYYGQYNGQQATSTKALTLTGGGNIRVFGTGINFGTTGVNLVLNGVISESTAGSSLGVFMDKYNSLTIGGANTFTGPTTIQSGSLEISTIANGGVPSPLGMSSNSPANLVIDGSIGMLAGGELLLVGANPNYSTDRGVTTKGGVIEVQNAGTILTISGQVTGRALYVGGAGTLSLTNASNNYTGGTTIFGGTLRAANTSGSATGTYTVTVASGGTLAGGDGGGSTNPFADSTQGFISGAVIVQTEGILAPGINGAGLLTVGGGIEFQAGSVLALYLASTNPRTGSLPADININSRIATPLNIMLDGSLTIDIDGGGEALTPGLDYDFYIAKYQASNGFPPQVTFVPTDFASPVNASEFSLSQSANGQELILTFVPVPEPGTLALVIFAVSPAAILRGARLPMARPAA